MRQSSLLPGALAAIMVGNCFAVRAQTTESDLIDALRQELRQSLDPASLGAGYAAMINFAVNPDISTATYNIDDELEPVLKVSRLPIRHVFKWEEQRWRPFVQANLAYQTLKLDFTVPDEAPIFAGESVDLKWSVRGVTLATGVELPFEEYWTFEPAIAVGTAHLSNDASYHGPLFNEFLKPALEGWLFDWDADAWLAGIALKATYQRPLKTFDFSLSTGLDYNHIETFDSSSSEIDFSSQATTLSIQAETVHPTPFELGNYPLALVVDINNTTFLGPERDALGFEYFFEGGLALEANLSREGWPVKKARLGAKAIYGEDVTGWTLILGYRF